MDHDELVRLWKSVIGLRRRLGSDNPIYGTSEWREFTEAIRPCVVGEGALDYEETQRIVDELRYRK